jgi:hypothetical protein
MKSIYLGAALLICLTAQPVNPLRPTPDFSTSDTLLILVTGNTSQSRPFGYSGEATVYKASGSSSAGRLAFSPVSGAERIPVERRSGADINNTNNYGTDGYIPPGIYFLHYHRFDSSAQQARHRLGLSDRKCGESIRVQVGNQSIDRSNLQFHVAFNDLEDFHPDVSKGCITLTTQRFFELFRDNFFSTSSPLPSCSSHQTPAQFVGQGNILVFVTDATSTDRQDNQLLIFNGVVAGNATNGLSTPDFGNGSPTQRLTTLRTVWRAALP